MAPIIRDDDVAREPAWAGFWRSFMKQVNAKLPTVLNTLLGEKHLYESVSLDSEKLMSALGQSLTSEANQAFRKRASDWLDRLWIVDHFDRSAAPPMNSPLDPHPSLVLHPVEIVCNACKRRTAHVPVTWSNDTDTAVKQRMAVRQQPKETTQVFTFLYQCQACHSYPICFLVARKGDCLRLEGRSPIELVEIPTHIPKQEAAHFRAAIVARSTGHSLAGLFYLRTTIEQFARRIVAFDGRATGDEIMEAYGQTLPADIRGRLPSLKNLYDRLSVAMHSAKDDTQLFDEVATQISKHFDMRRALEVS